MKRLLSFLLSALIAAQPVLAAPPFQQGEKLTAAALNAAFADANITSGTINNVLISGSSINTSIASLTSLNLTGITGTNFLVSTNGVVGPAVAGTNVLAVANGGTGVANITGMVRANGTNPFTAALPGVDYVAPGGLSGSATNIAGGAAGEVPYQQAAGVTNFVPAGTTGQVMLSGGTGAPTFANQSALTAGSANNLTSGATGSIPYQSATGTTAMLSGNTTTTPQFVTSTGTGSAAQNPTLTSSTGTGSVVLANGPTLTLSNATGLPLTTGVTGTLGVGNGGLGSTTSPTNGQIPIGNGASYVPATLTAGTGISITNGAGAITITNSNTGLGVANTVTASTTLSVVGEIVPVSMSSSGQTITLPNATTVTLGPQYIFQNTGAYSFTVRDNSGGFLADIPPGGTADLTLTANSTAAGVWGIGNKTPDASLLMAHPNTATVLDTVAASLRNTSTVSLTNTTFVTAFTSASGTIAVLYSLSGSTVSVLSTITLDAFPNISVGVVPLTSTTALVVYLNSSSYPTAVVLTNSSGTLVAGSPVNISASSSTYVGVAAVSSTQAVVLFQNASYPGNLASLTVSGTSVSVGSSVGNSFAANVYGFSIVMLSATSGIAICGQSNSYAQVQLFSLSGTTITLVGSVTGFPGTYWGYSAGARFPLSIPLSSTTFLSIIGNSNGQVLWVVGEVSGSSLVTKNSGVLESTASSNLVSYAAGMLGSSKGVIFSNNGSARVSATRFTYSGDGVFRMGNTETINAFSAGGYPMLSAAVAGNNVILSSTQSSSYPTAQLVEVNTQ